MADRDPPAPAGTADDAALSFAEGVEDLTDLLEDPDDPDLSGDDQGPDADGDGSGDPGPDDVGGAENDQDADGSDEVASDGKFVSSDAKFKLDDGTVISVGDLARNNLFQRDYTRKTEELKAEKQELDAGKEKVGGYALALAAKRDFLLEIMPLYGPQPPDDEMLDPNSSKYEPLEYINLKAQFEKARDHYNQLRSDRQAEQQRLQGESAAELQTRQRTEAKLLADKVPAFRDRKVYDQFWTDANKTMTEKYGFTPEEIAGQVDHRMYLAMNDLVKFHKAMARRSEVQKQVNGRPPLLRSGQRPDPKSRTTRDAKGRDERLRKTGTFEAGIAALMDLDL